MLIDESIRKEITPHRVYCLLKLIAHKEYNKDDLKKLIQPSGLSNGTEFNKVFSYLKGKAVISEDTSGKVLTVIPSKYLQTPDQFRKYYASKIFEGISSNLFFDYTAWYMAQDTSILSFSSFENLINNIRGKFGKLDKEFILAWRFWVSFIGLGFIHESQFIQNPFLRIKDAIEFNQDIDKGTEIPFRSFMQWMLTKCPEFREGVNGNELSFSVSFGLRTLHDNGFITLSIKQDSPDVWHLTKQEAHPMPQNISHVIIKG